MRKLTQIKKDNINELLHWGYSKHEISRILNIPRSTVIRHSFIKGKYNRPIKKFTTSYTQVDGEVVGIFAGDGSQYYEPKGGSYEVTIHIGRKNEEYLEYVKGLFENHFNKGFWVSKDKACFKLRTKSKAMFEYFSNYLDYNSKIKHSTVKLKSLNLPRDFKIGFLKGFLDTDGTIIHIEKEKRTRASYCTTSEQLSKQVHIVLNQFEIRNSIYVCNRNRGNEKTVYYVEILKSSVDNFISLTKPLKARTG
ncbi:hypothetical protein CMO83_04350 [Candidatus Woesearchaeota archaeon]|jgi:intein/homing endonuclease|nr:hypothetical protein [Candidatus Woesearchaeota archaeon]|tara:strand:- start:6102 stop:6854 length:753 start_codon:yes stop_codon:yes gene_type:complete